MQIAVIIQLKTMLLNVTVVFFFVLSRVKIYPATFDENLMQIQKTSDLLSTCANFCPSVPISPKIRQTIIIEIYIYPPIIKLS